MHQTTQEKQKRSRWVWGWLMLVLLPMLCATAVADESCLIGLANPDSGWNSLTAPIIPPENTLSSNRVYLGLFRTTSGPLWEGDVVRLGLSAENEIIDRNGDPALDTDGMLTVAAEPFWSAKNWANPSMTNFIANDARNIYTYLGTFDDLTLPENEFRAGNTLLTAGVLGNPINTPAHIINYVRGADVFDADGDTDTGENRASILGDVVHSQPLAFTYHYADNSSERLVFFGANDGMLHAVLDSEMDADGDETISGIELWGFIPPDQLHRLKNMVEGTTHHYFVDASPKVFVRDTNDDGILDAASGDQAVLVCGERGGGTGYFALDVTDPRHPRFLWRINRTNDAALLGLPAGAGPDHVLPALGQTWSDPVFALVKTSDEDDTGTPVFFIGGGYTPDNSAGKAILAIRVADGSLLRLWQNGTGGISQMRYAVPSAVSVVDEDDDGFADKLYVGDVGGQLWRIGKFVDEEGTPLPFPEAVENSLEWEAHTFFFAGVPGDPPSLRKFFYPPSVALEKGYDLLLIGTGDRDDPCKNATSDRIYAIKDANGNTMLTERDLVDVTTSSAVPDLDDETADKDANGSVDRGWFIRLASGEKVLANGLLFNTVYYATTFTPTNSGGSAALYGLYYKTGEPALFASTSRNSRTRTIVTGVSIPSAPVPVITAAGPKIIVSKTLPTPAAETSARGAQTAGILAINPAFPTVNFFYLWWMQH